MASNLEHRFFGFDFPAEECRNGGARQLAVFISTMEMRSKANNVGRKKNAKRNTSCRFPKRYVEMAERGKLDYLVDLSRSPIFQIDIVAH